MPNPERRAPFGNGPRSDSGGESAVKADSGLSGAGAAGRKRVGPDRSTLATTIPASRGSAWRWLSRTTTPFPILRESEPQASGEDPSADVGHHCERTTRPQAEAEIPRVWRACSSCESERIVAPSYKTFSAAINRVYKAIWCSSDVAGGQHISSIHPTWNCTSPPRATVTGPFISAMSITPSSTWRSFAPAQAGTSAVLG